MACLSSLYSAARYEELLSLLEDSPFNWWGYRSWAVKALVAMNKPEDALRYAEDSKGLNAPVTEIARTCEEILLSMGSVNEAYDRYALAANQSMTYLATFQAMKKKYPHKPAKQILHDLIENSPNAEGKWFAAAKKAGFFDIAIELASRSPTDPHTLIRAAKEFASERPDFAMAAGLASLHWIALGYGYKISNSDVLSAYTAISDAAKTAGVEEAQVKEKIRALISDKQPAEPLAKYPHIVFSSL